MTSAGASIWRSAPNFVRIVLGSVVLDLMYHLVHVPHGTLPTMRKQELLDAVAAEVARGGIGDRSLREIGAAVGTSHRMLIHHFGSREGLLTEVVRKVEADQRLFLESLQLDPEQALDQMWARV